MIQTKSEWRRALLRTRSAIPKDTHRRHSTAIARRVGRFSWMATARSVLAYRPIGAEVDASVFLAHRALADVPRYAPASTDGDEPRWARWCDGPGDGFETPPLTAAELRYPALVLVPGVGFDPHGVRLGRGAGFYDRALADLRRCGAVCAVGLAFECQIVPALPMDPWDQRVDCIVTERRAFGSCDDALMAAEHSG